MRHGSLFSGIGGFDLAAEWMGWENIFQVEWDNYCQKVLAKNFPNIKRYGDIREFNGTQYRGAIDIISGGFPCQPFSHAGKRKGQADDRYLWPEMLRVIKEIKPAFVLGENVAGLVSMENGKTLQRIFSDLENEGYQTESFIIPACGVGAWHRRERVWILAYTLNCSDRTNGRQSREAENVQKEHWQTGLSGEFSGTGESFYSDCKSNGLEKRRMAQYDNKGRFPARDSVNVSDSKKQRIQGIRRLRKQVTEENVRQRLSVCSDNRDRTSSDWWESEPSVGRVANGIPNRVDRLKGLGNAIVPQIAFQLFKAIAELENI